jgi:aspartate-semialdehyde dehydrogenase
MSVPHESVRVVIAGAASLRGKELKDWLEESKFPAAEIRLIDEEIAAGTLTVAAGEPAVIETVEPDSFANARFVFFTGSPGFSQRHTAEAQNAGAVVIDLSGGPINDQGAKPWIPSLDPILTRPKAEVTASSVQSLFLVPSAPADVAISLSAALRPIGLTRLVLTFFQPASERGREAIEELESQVVNLLSFQPIAQTVFDAQVGFNMLSRFGQESREKLEDIRGGIAREIQTYLDGRLPTPAISLIQAPVFYSHAFTAYAEFEVAPVLSEIVLRIKRAGLEVTSEDEDPPTNISVVGETRPVLGQPRRDPSIANGVWLWGAADNMRVPVASAVSIAVKLLAS